MDICLGLTAEEDALELGLPGVEQLVDERAYFEWVLGELEHAALDETVSVFLEQLPEHSDEHLCVLVGLDVGRVQLQNATQYFQEFGSTLDHSGNGKADLALDVLQL